MCNPVRALPSMWGMLRLLLAAGVLALAGAAGGARADNAVLTGDVAPNDSFNISLAGPDGSRVTHLDPGGYTLVVHDHSELHNFHLRGPGVNVATPIESAGDFSFPVTLTDGTYRFVCDAHPTTMTGSFTVGNPPAAPPAPTKLVGSLGPGAKISLRAANGSRLSSLAPGAFVIAVADRSATDGFRLSGPGTAKATGIAFRGTATWRVTLKAGSYTYRSVRHPKLRGSFRLSG
jgi:plastocyanin